MKALVTGASSGLGKDMALYLSSLGYELILVSRNKDGLEEVKKSAVTNCLVVVADLSKVSDVEMVLKVAIDERIDVLINNAGFGVFGEFSDTLVSRELDMINVNVVAVHILCKGVYKYMSERGSGYILNVASSAGLMPGGPLLSSYYATKSYVRSLTLGIYEEERRKGGHVHISLLCPGPVNTNFNKVAGTSFNISSLESEYVSKYAIRKMFKNKLVIIPGVMIKCGIFFQRFVSNKFVLKVSYNIQSKKRGK